MPFLSNEGGSWKIWGISEGRHKRYIVYTTLHIYTARYLHSSGVALEAIAETETIQYT